MYTPFLIKPDASLLHITKTICKRIDVYAIYCFACQESAYDMRSVFQSDSGGAIENRHYWILVVANDIPMNLVADIADTVGQRSAGCRNVTPVFYRVDELEKLPQNEQCFIDWVMARGQEIFRKDGFERVRWSNPPIWNHDTADKRWRYHKCNAACLLEAEAGIGSPNAGAVQVVLMHAAMEHLCLGLIAVMLGHRPRHFALNYLMSLCAGTASFVSEIFPSGSHEDNRLLKALSATMNTLRHRKMESPAVAEVEILRQRVHTFNRHAIALAEERMAAIALN